MPHQAPAEKTIEFRGVSYGRDGRWILRNLNFSVSQGETFVLLGRSGCGKTTTLKLMNRLLEPTEGSVVVEGKAASDWDPIVLRRHIGYVIQETGLFPHFTVERNVGLIPALEKWKPQQIRRRTQELLRMVGMDPETFRQRYPSELSGGQRQRVGVARALGIDPPILLMDEPFGALDPLTRAEVRNEFRELQKRLRKTVVLVTHDLYEALVLGDRIALMKEGALLMAASAGDLLASTDPAVTGYLKPLRELKELIG